MAKKIVDCNYTRDEFKDMKTGVHLLEKYLPIYHPISKEESKDKWKTKSKLLKLCKDLKPLLDSIYD